MVAYEVGIGILISALLALICLLASNKWGKESTKWFHVGTIIAIVVVLIVKAIKDRKWRFFS